MPLVLARKTYESIRIGDNITVTVVRIAEGKVRLSVDAPKEVNIVRTEVLQRQEKQSQGRRHDCPQR